MLISLLSGLSGLIAFGINIAVLVAVIRFTDRAREQLRPGLILAIVALALTIPSSLISVIYLDLDALMAQQGQTIPPDLAGFMGPFLKGIAISSAGFTMILGFIWTVMSASVATMADPEREPFPLLSGGSDRSGLLLGALLGAAAAGITTVIYLALDVQEGDIVHTLRAIYPGVSWESPAVVLGMGMTWACAAAIKEELLYRGVAQRWLQRWLGDSPVSTAIAIVLPTIGWTLAHAANTDNLAAKFIQIFLLGLIFGGLARRYSVEASIVAHLSLNIVAVLLTLVL